jgi:hypothetical protein
MNEKDNNGVIFPDDFEVEYKDTDEEKDSSEDTQMMDEITLAINAKLEEYKQEELALEEAQGRNPVVTLKQETSQHKSGDQSYPQQVSNRERDPKQINNQERYSKHNDQESHSQQINNRDGYSPRNNQVNKKKTTREDSSNIPTASNPQKAEHNKKANGNSDANRNAKKGGAKMSPKHEPSSSSRNPKSGPPPKSKKAPRARRTKKKSKAKRNLIIFACLLFTLFIAYCGVAFYFTSRFLFNTQINGVTVSTLTPDEVIGNINSITVGYTLTIVNRDGEIDIIRGEDIALAYHDTGEIQALLDSQEVFTWPLSFITTNSIETPIGVEFDGDLLEREIQNTRAFSLDQVPPTSAFPEFNGAYYEIVPEELGSTLDLGRMRELVHNAIHSFSSEINLEHEGLYASPRFTSESVEVINARDTMNTFLDASITYPMDNDVVVDSSYIIDWISIDNDMNPILYEERVANWVESFADTYDTVGTTRQLSTPAGRTVEVSGGFYGWRINREEETATLIANIRQGEVVNREPIYSQRAAVHEGNDWGNTFIQVDLSAQMMWYFQDGILVLESPIVTGLPGSMATPPGVFFILEMLRDTILEGAINPDTGVEADPTPVAYWMRVTWEGIGFHDAGWQESFGGDRYQTFGSHGCINMPPENAGDLFSRIDIYTPVVIHH